MVLTIDDKVLAYLVAKLPLKTREFEASVKELLKILHIEKKGYESQFEDSEYNLFELSLLISHFEKMLRALNSVSVRLYIKDLKSLWNSAKNHLKKI